jgi:hypothetical protein
MMTQTLARYFLPKVQPKSADYWRYAREEKRLSSLKRAYEQPL